jgi:hypothetical protein
MPQYLGHKNSKQTILLSQFQDKNNQQNFISSVIIMPPPKGTLNPLEGPGKQALFVWFHFNE